MKKYFLGIFLVILALVALGCNQKEQEVSPLPVINEPVPDITEQVPAEEEKVVNTAPPKITGINLGEKCLEIKAVAERASGISFYDDPTKGHWYCFLQSANYQDDIDEIRVSWIDPLDCGLGVSTWDRFKRYHQENRKLREVIGPSLAGIGDYFYSHHTEIPYSSLTFYNDKDRCVYKLEVHSIFKKLSEARRLEYLSKFQGIVSLIANQ